MIPIRSHGEFEVSRAFVLAVVLSLLAHVAVVMVFSSTLSANADLRRSASFGEPNEFVAISHPVSVEHRTSESVDPALERFDLRMRGKHSRLRRGQGYYEPLSSYVAGGVRYYRVAYGFVYRDGTVETGVVPWPVHFDAERDPFVRGAEGGPLETPLPPPPADYMPPGTLGKALRAYFPQLRFED